MDVYKRETEEIIRRFHAGRLSYPECRAALDVAVADVIPYLTPAQVDSLQAIAAATNEVVTREMERRKLQRAQATMGSQGSLATR